MNEKLFTRIANTVAHLAGLPPTFAVCCLIVAVWAVSGPFFGDDDVASSELASSWSRKLFFACAGVRECPPNPYSSTSRAVRALLVHPGHPLARTA